MIFKGTTFGEPMFASSSASRTLCRWVSRSFCMIRRMRRSWICLHPSTHTRLQTPHTTAPFVRDATKRGCKRKVASYAEWAQSLVSRSTGRRSTWETLCSCALNRGTNSADHWLVFRESSLGPRCNYLGVCRISWICCRLTSSGSKYVFSLVPLHLTAQFTHTCFFFC
jgi:hypothetical protein